MNKFLTLPLVAALLVINTACAKEEPKKPVAAAPSAAAPSAAAPAAAANKKAEAVPAKNAAAAKEEKSDAPETKRVCITVTDSKTGKPVEKCREMKIHKKYEGTAVPTK
jgi:hypothetical protein